MDEFLNGFYSDDGELIDKNSIPVPGLCILCESHQTDDPEENLLCLMNRYDQLNSNEFRCGAFQKVV